MAQLITTIALSSGKLVKFPVFPHEFTDDYKIYSRGGGVQRIYQGNVVIYNDITEEDLLELGNIILGRNYDSLTYDLPTLSGHYALSFGWIYRRQQGKYFLNSCFREYNNSIVVDANSSPNWGIASEYYYNNENVNNTGDNRNFYSRVQNMQDNPDAYQAEVLNLRLGSIPTIDYATKNAVDYAGGYIGNLPKTLDELIINIERFVELNPDSNINVTIFDPDTNDDPYIVDDPSNVGGGFGDREQDVDEIEKAEIPPLPTLSAVNTGMITLYNCTESQLNALGAYLWSDIFDVDTNFKKLFSDPMDCIIGLGILPVQPTLSGGANVKFGNINTNVSMSKVASQYVEKDCGSINLKEYIGSFLDYAPYVHISIYLPYIGFRDLSPDDVMNDTVHVVYHVDVLTGGCCAMVETSKKGLLYSFNGSCITNVPLTAINYSGAIQNAVSAVGAGATTIAGIATGVAPLTAMGTTQLLSSGANTALNSKPSISRSGSMGGSAGLMSYQKPYLVINRPRMSVPANLNKFVGNTLNVTMNLGTLKGFTQIELIHLDGIPCTDNERNELESLLKGGVIF